MVCVSVREKHYLDHPRQETLESHLYPTPYLLPLKKKKMKNLIQGSSAAGKLKPYPSQSISRLSALPTQPSWRASICSFSKRKDPDFLLFRRTTLSGNRTTPEEDISPLISFKRPPRSPQIPPQQSEPILINSCYLICIRDPMNMQAG